ncbi:MAG: hypothetical protein IJ062_10165 [Firmicutes bacterium]|nr:hypothetical protein [Bacillota bacterium]
MTGKQKNSIILVYGIVLAVFTLLFFVIPFTRTAAVWTAFVFAEISIVLGYFITNYAFDKRENLTSKIYGFPILRISYIYTITQLIFSLLIFVLNKVVVTPAWIAAVVSILLLAAVLIGTIAADNARDIVENVDTKIEQKIQQVKTFRLNADSLVSACTDKDAKKQLEKLAEKIKYSDPVSSPALEGIEHRITTGIEELRQMIINGKYEGISAKISAVDMLVDDRNRRCKAEKEH